MDAYAPVFGKNSRIRISSSEPFTPSFVISNLKQASDPKAIYDSRVRGRHILLENPVADTHAKREAQKKRENRKRDREKKKVALGGMHRKHGGQWKLVESQARFKVFLPLHHLWMGYMSELLGLGEPSDAPPTLKSAPSSASMHPKLVKADFHGSLISVKHSKHKALEGLGGIVIHETEGTFRIVTQENTVKLLPKQNTIFNLAIPLYMFTKQQDEIQPITVLNLPHLLFELYGNQFRFRAADRASRKFKHKETIEL